MPAFLLALVSGAKDENEYAMREAGTFGNKKVVMEVWVSSRPEMEPLPPFFSSSPLTELVSSPIFTPVALSLHLCQKYPHSL